MCRCSFRDDHFNNTSERYLNQRYSAGFIKQTEKKIHVFISLLQKVSLLMWEILGFFFCSLHRNLSFERTNKFFLCWLSPHYSLSAHHNYITAPFHCSCLLSDHLGWLPFGSGLIIQPISSIFNPQGSLPPTPQLMDDPLTLGSPLCLLPLFLSVFISSAFHSLSTAAPSLFPSADATSFPTSSALFQTPFISLYSFHLYSLILHIIPSCALLLYPLCSDRIEHPPAPRRHFTKQYQSNPIRRYPWPVCVSTLSEHSAERHRQPEGLFCSRTVEEWGTKTGEDCVRGSERREMMAKKRGKIVDRREGQGVTSSTSSNWRTERDWLSPSRLGLLPWAC